MSDSTPQSKTTKTDVLIVGAGPIGLEVAVALRNRGLNTLNVDRGALASQIMAFPPGIRFFSSPERIAIAGVPLQTVNQEKATREEYLAYLRSVALMHELPLRTHEEVVGVEGSKGDFSVRTRTLGGVNRTLHAEMIVLAVGGTAGPRQLGIPGEELPHVSSEVGEVHRFFKRRVLVIGGKNSAAESALRIWRAQGHVALCSRSAELHPRIKYWIRPELEVLLRNNFIRGHFSTRPVEILPDRVVLEHVDTAERSELVVDDVLLQIGFEADPTLFNLLGCRLDGETRRVTHDPDSMETTVPGVFVAGTAIAGTQGRFEIYIENSHVHAARIAAHMMGEPPPETPRLPELPEA
ncbi:MAG: NAD(P)-binding domain-containing protein [Phycisphaerales bacterium]|nr:NAD(P)-binding domain-containing protein [Phycisphaerales bacterium]